MELVKLIHTLYEQGLGEHLVLHLNKGKVILSNLTFDKGRMVMKDKNYLPDCEPARLKACWENGTLGMVTQSEGHEWESLTFFGLEHCKLPADLSSTRHGALAASENQFGDNLIDFVGSAYRAIQLMLDSHYLPVILLKPIENSAGETGLIVSDLRMMPMEISLIQTIHEVVRKSVDSKIEVDIDDANLNTAEFEGLFGSFMSKD
ncbi:MAG: hypothetical protein HN764_07580 [Gammaproteobacteria bacterium]|jgi:hypothetical protein|nr:hypothetical protein [Gammaproteobacteria bacterium]